MATKGLDKITDDFHVPDIDSCYSPPNTASENSEDPIAAKKMIELYPNMDMGVGARVKTGEEFTENPFDPYKSSSTSARRDAAEQGHVTTTWGPIGLSRRSREDDRLNSLQDAMNRLLEQVDGLKNEQKKSVTALRAEVDQRLTSTFAARTSPETTPTKPGVNVASGTNKYSFQLGTESTREYRNPDPFHGTTGDWDSYAKYFKGVVRWNQWREEEAKEALILALKGDAASYVYSLPDYEDMDLMQLYSALDDRFGAERTQAEDKIKLRNRKKRPQETYQQLAQDITSLANRVYSHSSHYAQQAARESFLKALPTSIRTPIVAANPKSMQDCIDCAVNFESVMGIAAAEEEPTSADPEAHCFKTTKMEVGKCYGCGGSGHFARDCPSRINNPNNYNAPPRINMGYNPRFQASQQGTNFGPTRYPASGYGSSAGNSPYSPSNGTAQYQTGTVVNSRYQRPANQNMNVRPLICWNCDEAGHVMRQCRYQMRPVNDQGRRYGPKLLIPAPGDGVYQANHANNFQGFQNSGNGQGPSN